VLERWQNPGDESQFRKIDGSPGFVRTRATSRFVMVNNEFQLASMNVSYRMAAQEYPVLKRMGLSGVSFGLYWNDIVRFSTVRMEHGIFFPFARTISFTIGATFT
jgi:hypothetical protein